MAGSRGYHSYRGRTPKWKIVLAVILVLVILAAVGFMILQEHIIYDESGRPHLRLPEEEQQAEAVPQEDVELTIQAPAVQEDLHAVSIPEGTLTQADVEAFLAEAAEQSAVSYGAVAVTLKNSAGRVYFDSGAAVSGSVDIGADTAAVLESLTGEDSGWYTIARLSCFHDPKAANSDVEGMGLKNTGGYIFYDGNNSQWLDPAKPAARQYLCELAGEAAELGFDEILLTDVSYPTEGKLDKIAYGDGDRAANLMAFLAELRSILEPYGVVLSMELPEEVITTGANDAAGLVLADIAPHVDRIYARTSPERVSALSGAVAAASATTAFVPELTDGGAMEAGSYLILAE